MENTITIKVTGMSCGGCAMTVRKALEAVDGVISATADHTSGTATVHYKDNRPSVDNLIAAVEKAGYEANHPS